MNPSESTGDSAPAHARHFIPPTFGNDPQRDVFLASYAARGKPKLTIPDAVRVTSVFHPPPIFVFGIVMVLLFAIGRAGSRLTGFPTWGVIITLAVPAIFGTFVTIRRLRVPRAPRTSTLEPAPAIDPNYRLCVIASRHEAHAIGALDDAAFEPLVAPVYFALRGKTWITIVVWALAGLTLCLLWAVFRQRLGAYSPTASNPWEWWACFGIASAPLIFLWPTYLRVSPGRLDVFQYGLLGSGAPKVTTLDLRSARVMVDLPARQIIVEHADGSRRVVSFGAWTPRPLELTRLVLQAARWRHDLPELSTDELSG